ncbi:DUF6153 family protein [Longispora sp. K20-0274]|uniref:hypothetical protein n=1 Tax=Longispora sp. K20-0274 TaxID=3088255 RepID=UPI003999DA22
MPARSLRLAFLALLALGIACMHTLGHPSAGHGATPTMAAMAGAAHPHPLHAAGSAVEAFEGFGTGLDPMTMCLAILTISALAFLLLAVKGLRSATWSAGDTTILAQAMGPGPPPSARQGLVLTELSVLRI